MPDSGQRLIPDCKVIVAGKPLALDDDARLTRVVVDLDADLFGQCALTFNDPKLQLIDGTRFASGTHVEVRLGFGSSLGTVFQGEVVALEPQFRRDLPPALRVVCHESIHRLALTPKTRAFNDVDDKQIVTRIAREHGLTADAPTGSKQHTLQANVSDAAFLRRLARKHGNHLRIEGRKLVIAPPPTGATIAIAPGDGLLKLKVRLSSRRQIGEVTVHGWDPKAKREIVGKAKPPPGEVGDGARKHGSGKVLSFAGHEHAPTDVASAESMAKGRLRALAEDFVVARGTMTGDARVVPGAMLELNKISPGVDGGYRVAQARHEFSRRGYFVEFKSRRVTAKTAATRAAKAAQAAASQQTRQTSATSTRTGKDWLEIELADDNGQPMSNAPYRVVFADGSSVDGVLDARGKARLENVPPGEPQVSFTSLHGADVEKR